MTNNVDAITGAAPWFRKKMDEDVGSAAPMPTKKLAFSRKSAEENGSTGNTGKKQGMGFPESKKKGFPNPIDGGMPKDAPETGKFGGMGSDKTVNKDLAGKTIEKTFQQDREDTIKKFAGNSGITPPYIQEQLNKMRSALISKYGKDAFSNMKFSFKYDDTGSLLGVFDKDGNKVDLSGENKKKDSFMDGGTVGSKEREGSDMEDSPEVKVEIEAGDKEEVAASLFDKIKDIEGADVDLVDRATKLMTEEPEDEAEYKAELMSVIADAKASKQAAKASNSEDLAMAYGEMLMSLEEFASELSGMQQDVAMFRGKKMNAVMG